jgi:hypothetical protein
MQVQAQEMIPSAREFRKVRGEVTMSIKPQKFPQYWRVQTGARFLSARQRRLLVPSPLYKYRDHLHLLIICMKYKCLAAQHILRLFYFIDQYGFEASQRFQALY